MAQDTVPRGALIAVGVMLAVTLAFTAAVQISKLSAPAVMPSAPASKLARNLRFSDEADGSISVRDADTGRAIEGVAPGTGGFVRGVLRGLARDRMARHIGQAPPFRLSEDLSGKLWLQDTATGRLIDMEAFGSINRGSFKTLLTAPETAS